MLEYIKHTLKSDMDTNHVSKYCCIFIFQLRFYKNSLVDYLNRLTWLIILFNVVSELKEPDHDNERMGGTGMCVYCLINLSPYLVNYGSFENSFKIDPKAYIVKNDFLLSTNATFYFHITFINNLVLWVLAESCLWLYISL